MLVLGLMAIYLLPSPHVTGGSEVQNRSLYILLDEGGKRWCAYEAEPRWMSAVEDAEARKVAVVVYEGGRLKTIKVEEADESGDWRLSDLYTMDARGAITGLDRITAFFPDRVEKEEIFQISRGRARMQRKTLRSTLAGGIGEPDDSSVPKGFPIALRLEDLPFEPLLKKARRLAESEPQCISVRSAAAQPRRSGQRVGSPPGVAH